MTAEGNRFSRIGAVFLLLLLLSARAAVAQGVATVYSIQGPVEVQSGAGAQWTPVDRGARLDSGWQIRTGKAARVGLKFDGGRLVRLREHSQLRIESGDQNAPRSGRLSLTSGVAHLFSRRAQEFPEVTTSEVSAAIRGTEFVIATEQGRTTVTVLDGEVEMRNGAGRARLRGGEQGTATATAAPVRRLVANPEDAVDWALDYPLIFDAQEYASLYEGGSPESREGWAAIEQGDWSAARARFSESDWRSVFGRAAALIGRGRLEAASEELEALPADAPALTQTVRSGLYLALGQVTRFRQAVEQLSAQISADSDPQSKAALLSQQALEAIVQNEPVRALEYAEEATRLAPGSITAAIARSYVHQGRLELEAAFDWANDALRLNPENPYSMARKAELLLGFGYLKDAAELAERGAELAPESGYVRSVAGYAHLTRYETAAARKHFSAAIAENSSDGLAFLGEALARIREGELESGRALLEQAVHLEPQNALFRSYLGKAYFEEEKEDLAENEFDRAILLDPQDPTPYLYRAFNRLSRNRPVEALQDIEASIERNSNRAVFRSSLLLDQDLAVRGASLSEAFSQLGFARIAQLEAIKAINRDYSNYSAHRLLAESYVGDFFSDARFTESIVANLLAPLSFNVFSNLTGFAGDASLNEYSALFDRPVQRTGITGSYITEEDFATGNIFQTGVVDKFGYLLGYQAGYGDGHKHDGVFSRLHRFDLATQYQVDPDNRLVLQTAYTRTDERDELAGSKLDDFEVSIGSHHRFGPHSDAITRIEYLDRSPRGFDRNVFIPFEHATVVSGELVPNTSGEFFVDQRTDEDFRSLRYSAQYIYDATRFSLVMGGQVLDSEGDGEDRNDVLGDSTGLFADSQLMFQSRGKYETDSYSTYAYGTVHVAPWLDVDVGLNWTEIQLPRFDVLPPFVDGERHDSQLSPKAGLTLYPTDQLTIRSAYFQTLGISSIDDIGSLEPTLVGSFTQVLGDLPGARAENMGIGIDYKIPASTYFGAEYLYRDIERESVDTGKLVVTDFDTFEETVSDFEIFGDEQEREHVLRSYIYQVLSRRATASLDYTRSELTALDIGEHNDTDLVRLGLNYFSTDYWFLFGRASWVHQELRGADGFDDGTEAFWLLDAGIGYRIPKRHGALRLVFRNLLDEEFELQDRGRQETLLPEFHVRLEASVNF